MDYQKNSSRTSSHNKDDKETLPKDADKKHEEVKPVEKPPVSHST